MLNLIKGNEYERTIDNERRRRNQRRQVEVEVEKRRKEADSDECCFYCVAPMKIDRILCIDIYMDLKYVFVRCFLNS